MKLFLIGLAGRTLLPAGRLTAYLLGCVFLVLYGGNQIKGVEAGRPNILWITAEDLSPHLGCYGDRSARTPELDALSKEGVRYTRAFATAPVCSPARSCLITGLYATSLGTQRLRSQFPVPKQARGFAALLREAGYYCANNVKTDYNLRDEAEFIRDCWDDCSVRAHWRGRKPGQPFLAVFNLMTTHQTRASVWPRDEFEKEVGAKLSAEERHDPARVQLPPYYPDTPEARRAWARYHDCITLMDKQVGKILRDLAQDGLAEDTIVFFYGDNGMGLPRGKRCLFDTGLREPLLIRFPKRFAHWAPAPPGQASHRLVSFVDFAPTVLSLCQVKAPPLMQGVAFLGPAAGPPRDYVYGARDRVDEAFDLSRSVRNGRFLYIRNYMPHLSWMQPENFSDASPFRRQLKELARDGKLNAAQLSYARPGKSLEELYDTASDPHQVHNLASLPEHRATLEEMRGELRRWLLAARDAGFLTEPQIWERMAQAKMTPWELAQNESWYPLSRLLEAADRVGRPEAVLEQIRLLSDSDDGVRYWAAVGLHAAGSSAAPVIEALRKALRDASAVVRIEAATALTELGEPQDALPILESELQSDQPETVLHAARALELLGQRAHPVYPALRHALRHARQKEAKGGDIFMFIRFSLESALREIEE